MPQTRLGRGQIRAVPQKSDNKVTSKKVEVEPKPSEPPGPNLTDLPNEILTDIFGCLGYLTLHTKVRLVCRRFNGIVIGNANPHILRSLFRLAGVTGPVERGLEVHKVSIKEQTVSRMKKGQLTNTAKDVTLHPCFDRLSVDVPKAQFGFFNPPATTYVEEKGLLKPCPDGKYTFMGDTKVGDERAFYGAPPRALVWELRLGSAETFNQYFTILNQDGTTAWPLTVRDLAMTVIGLMHEVHYCYRNDNWVVRKLISLDRRSKQSARGIRKKRRDFRRINLTFRAAYLVTETEAQRTNFTPDDLYTSHHSARVQYVSEVKPGPVVFFKEEEDENKMKIDSVPLYVGP